MSYVKIDSESEEGSYMVEMSAIDIKRVKVLLKRYEQTGEWATEINVIIDRSKRIEHVGTINTYGDGGGWYEHV